MRPRSVSHPRRLIKPLKEARSYIPGAAVDAPTLCLDRSPYLEVMSRLLYNWTNC